MEDLPLWSGLGVSSRPRASYSEQRVYEDIWFPSPPTIRSASRFIPDDMGDYGTETPVGIPADAVPAWSWSRPLGPQALAPQPRGGSPLHGRESGGGPSHVVVVVVGNHVHVLAVVARVLRGHPAGEEQRV